MNTTQSYEYQAILEMTPSEAFSHLIKFGIVLERKTTLPPVLKLASDLGINQPLTTQYLIDYIHVQWVCTLQGGECIDVLPLTLES